MSEQDRVRWDARYADEPAGRHGPDPRPVVVRAFPSLPRAGSVLDLACGEGQSLLWLAERGMVGTGLDVSGVALARAAARAQALGVDVQWGLVDLDRWDAGQAQWDVVMFLRFFDRALLPEIRRAVRPGGWVLAEVLTTGRHAAGPNELLRAFVDWHVAWYEEADGIAALAAQRGQ
ncbi:MAG: class I SAM-dependent methyltransferase [Myxococcota bacterium]